MNAPTVEWLFLVGYLGLAFGLGLFSANAKRRWVRHSALFMAAVLPALLWLGMSVRDTLLFGQPIFDLTTADGRFGFYVGGIVALAATPIWLLAAVAGQRAQRGRREAVHFPRIGHVALLAGVILPVAWLLLR